MSGEDEDREAEPGEPGEGGEAEQEARKDRLVQTRVPRQLESTLKREARRSGPGVPAPRAIALPADPGAYRPATTAALSCADQRSGRELAEAFFAANPSNPLLRIKEPT